MQRPADPIANIRDVRVPRRISMRWWLAAAFAAVAALTAAAVVEVMNTRSEAALRAHAADLAVGSTVSAAEALKFDRTRAAVRAQTERLALADRTAFFVFDQQGRLLSGRSSNGATLPVIPHGAAALRAALGHHRFIEGSQDGASFTVAVRIHSGAGRVIVSYSLKPELAAQLGIVRNEGPRSALIAFALAAAAGLLIATLIGRRLGGIAADARAIGLGDFSGRRVDRFHDEVGSLSRSIDGMRRQLAALFGTLDEERSRLERLLGRLTDAVILVDRDGMVEFANDRGREFVAAGQRLDVDGGGGDDDGVALLARVASDLHASRAPVQLTTTLAEGRTLTISGIPPAADADAAIVVVTDETQRDRDERSQREFSTNAAHELRTPLAAIVTAIELLQTGAKEDTGARDEFLAVIERESARLTRLTRALLVLARAERREQAADARSIVRLRELFADLSEQAPAAPGVEVIVDCPHDLTLVANSDLLEQALANVLANAAQHTAGGSITLRASGGRDETLIEVVDTGSGIPAAEQQRIFERFYRAGSRDDGFGLGLTIAREAVRVLGGELRLDSTPGQGTTVRIRLPDDLMWEEAA